MGATVLVTGGSRGLGRAAVSALAAEPDTAVAFTWSSDEGAAREVEAATGARAFRLDLRDRAAAITGQTLVVDAGASA